MLKATFSGQNLETTAWRIRGTAADGSKIDAEAEFENDGREAWWCDGPVFLTGGIEPGDERWDEVLLAISASPDRTSSQDS